MAGDGAASRLAGNPQPVEIHHAGIWYSGELLGWRHTPDGRVAARVRCTVDGLRHSTWKDLAELRLPDPAHPPRREPFPARLARAVGAAGAGTRAVDVDEADRTRPHSLLAALTSRPHPPAHALTPPPAPRTAPEAAAPPARGPSSSPSRPRPTPYRRAPRPADAHRRLADGTVAAARSGVG
ncbi:hypothetical protein [Blastococcus xanthinilyticus]|uniref:Uncharacterized protein n=1 Tax=Blastococcus xanthinilyticus TaxID=1564164 RepID=A0A5S5D1R9_9ACTN|nr:hypothetical protein [Blastococcus xanthinilyticus]TYP89960.1 hypothetical protein BD833_102438 [Blastococcus xanthinilyticus]